LNQVVQEFEVVDQVTAPLYSTTEQDFLRRMRIRLRDNCVDGRETVEVFIGGAENSLVVSLEDLWEAIHGL
jgi:hypothetical protein